MAALANNREEELICLVTSVRTIVLVCSCVIPFYDYISTAAVSRMKHTDRYVMQPSTVNLFSFQYEYLCLYHVTS